MAILKVANVFHDASGYTRTQISTANTITWVTGNAERATLNATGVLQVNQAINSSNILVNGKSPADAANSYATSIGIAVGSASNTIAVAAFSQANVGFTLANAALPNTSGITFNGSLTFSHNMRVTGNAFFDGPGWNKIWRPTDNVLTFTTADLERIRIASTGNVGIGTTNPQQSLDVQGKINTSGIMVNSQPAYALANIRYFTGTTANTSYVPPVGCKAILVEIASGGGGGGSANGIGAGASAGGRGGGAGSYVAKLIANTNQTFKFTIGAGGAGGSGTGSGENYGADGGSTYFYGGSLGTTILLAVEGGDGGAYITASASPYWGVGYPGSGGSLGYDGDILLYGGGGGGASRGDVSGYAIGGHGGASFFSLYGGGGGFIVTGTDNGGQGYKGSGGGGGACRDTTGNASGGAGGDGLIRITEYY